MLRTVLVAPITRTIRHIPTEVPLGISEGLPVASAATMDNVFAIPKSMLVRRMGSLAPERQHELGEALFRRHRLLVPTAMREAGPVTDWNANIIEEFRENEGRVGGYFDGATMLLLHTTGRRTGKEYVNPLVYLPDGGRWVVVGSKGGAPADPDWVRNLEANPEATIEVGTEAIPVRATRSCATSPSGTTSTPVRSLGDRGSRSTR